MPIVRGDPGSGGTHGDKVADHEVALNADVTIQKKNLSGALILGHLGLDHPLNPCTRETVGHFLGSALPCSRGDFFKDHSQRLLNLESHLARRRVTNIFG